MPFVYLASPTGVPLASTLDLAEQKHVIVKAYFTGGTVMRTDSNLGALEPCQRLILAYRTARGIGDYVCFVLRNVAGRPFLKPLRALDTWPQGRANPAVFGAVVRGSPLERAVEDAGYAPDRRDPVLGAWVVICLDEDEGLDHDRRLLGALHDWYANLGNKQATVHRLPETILGGCERPGAAAAPPPPQCAAERTAADVVPAKRRAVKQPGIGVDFSGARDPASTTWLAEVVPNGGGLALVRCRRGWSHAQLAMELRGGEAARAVSLLDFPFGLAASTCGNLGLRQGADYPLAMWRAVAERGTPDAFREAARAGIGGPGSELPHRRNVDTHYHTPMAPVNLRLYRQSYHGQANVLLRVREDGGTIYPWDDVEGGSAVGWAGEGCPASTLRALGLRHTGYKGHTHDCRAAREAILAGLAVGFGLALTKDQCHIMLDDVGGDALDAVTLAVVAACVDQEQRAAGRNWCATHPSEAYVYI